MTVLGDRLCGMSNGSGARSPEVLKVQYDDDAKSGLGDWPCSGGHLPRILGLPISEFVGNLVHLSASTRTFNIESADKISIVLGIIRPRQEQCWMADIRSPSTSSVDSKLHLPATCDPPSDTNPPKQKTWIV